MKARWIRDSWEEHMLSKDKTMERRPDRGLGGDNFENLVVIGDTIQFPACDASGITVDYWSHAHSVDMHRHMYYEIALITQGTCQHYYRDTISPLVPGDIFMITPGEPHRYDISARVHIINCQFSSREADASFLEHVHTDTKNQWDSLLHDLDVYDQTVRGRQMSKDSFLDTQGIIHLEADDFQHVKGILLKMLDEQDEGAIGFEHAKLAWLNLLLISLQRVMAKKSQALEQYSSARQDIVYKALDFIDQHLEEKIDFEKLANDLYISPSYFRSLFRDMTGMAPLKYQNHRRIIKAMSYLETGQYSIIDAAANVGIYDANYFSRLFRKIMGYSPREYVKQTMERREQEKA